MDFDLTAIKAFFWTRIAPRCVWDSFVGAVLMTLATQQTGQENKIFLTVIGVIMVIKSIWTVQRGLSMIADMNKNSAKR